MTELKSKQEMAEEYRRDHAVIWSHVNICELEKLLTRRDEMVIAVAKEWLLDNFLASLEGDEFIRALKGKLR